MEELNNDQELRLAAMGFAITRSSVIKDQTTEKLIALAEEIYQFLKGETKES